MFVHVLIEPDAQKTQHAPETPSLTPFRRMDGPALENGVRNRFPAGG
jgi:hypothetical protein